MYVSRSVTNPLRRKELDKWDLLSEGAPSSDRERFECEHCHWDLKDGEPCMSKAKPEFRY